MASWREIEQAAPDFADRVTRRFAVGINKTIATLRKDGSPRISASELEFADGEVTLGMMVDSLKLRDVRRDPRIAVHSPTIDATQEGWLGDAKFAGRVVHRPAPADTPFPDAGFFSIDVTEVALTYVGDPADHLVIESWDTTHGYRRRTRK